MHQLGDILFLLYNRNYLSIQNKFVFPNPKFYILNLGVFTIRSKHIFHFVLHNLYSMIHKRHYYPMSCKDYQLARKLLLRKPILQNIHDIFDYPNPKLCIQHQLVVLHQLIRMLRWLNYILYNKLNIFHLIYPKTDNCHWLECIRHYWNKLFLRIFSIFLVSRLHKVGQLLVLIIEDLWHIFLQQLRILDSKSRKHRSESKFCINHLLDNRLYFDRNTILRNINYKLHLAMLYILYHLRLPNQIKHKLRL